MKHEGEPQQLRIPSVDGPGSRVPVSDINEPTVVQSSRSDQYDSVVPAETEGDDILPASGVERTVFDRVAEDGQQFKDAEAKREHLRALNTARVRRYRERHPERARAYITAYRRKKRAEQRRQQGPDAN